MKCPKCQQEMKVVEKKVTNNGKSEKTIRSTKGFFICVSKMISGLVIRL